MIAYEVKEGVAYIRLNRPEVLNALNKETLEQLAKALDNAARDGEVRAIVITGTGRAFCVGADLGELREFYERGEKINHGDILRQRYNPIIVRIRSIEKPVIAAINGVAAGAGIGIAAFCDLRVASSTAKFILAFGRVGLIPDSGLTYILPRIFGHGRTFEIYSSNREISVNEAHHFGLVDIVVDHSEFEAKVHEIAVKLASGPLKAYALLKRALNNHYFQDLELALEYEAYMQEVAGYTDDHMEGVLAFIQKREPRFKGK